MQIRERLAVFGSRSLSGPAVRRALLAEISRYAVRGIVTAGEPEGVSQVARDVARDLALPLTLHFADHRKRRAGAYHHRAIAIVKDADRVLLIHDGVSDGTANELEQCLALEVPHNYVTMQRDGDGDVERELGAWAAPLAT